MSSREMPFLAAAVVAGLVAGCASPPWQPPAYETAIKGYYQAHASEKNGRCLAPYIDGFTTVQVAEVTPERTVVEAAICTATGGRMAVTSRSTSASATAGAASCLPGTMTFCR